MDRASRLDVDAAHESPLIFGDILGWGDYLCQPWYQTTSMEDSLADPAKK